MPRDADPGTTRPPVWFVDLDKVARLLNTSPADLFHGLEASGVPIAAQTRKAPAESRPPKVLMSCSARPSVLDTETMPKELLHIGGDALLNQSLRQMASAGITEVVIVVGGKWSKAIIQSVLSSEVAERLTVRFVDLGKSFISGHAASLLAARDHFDANEPFILATSDHIFEGELLRVFCESPLPPGIHGRVLIEEHLSPAAERLLPRTAVRVERAGNTVLRIGRNLPSYLPLEAGLFLLDGKAFEALAFASEHTSNSSGHFTLADAMAVLASRRTLQCMETGGLLWVAVETVGQLQQQRRPGLPSLPTAREVVIPGRPMAEPPLFVHELEHSLSVRQGDDAASRRLELGISVGAGDDDVLGLRACPEGAPVTEGILLPVHTTFDSPELPRRALPPAAAPAAPSCVPPVARTATQSVRQEPAAKVQPGKRREVIVSLPPPSPASPPSASDYPATAYLIALHPPSTRATEATVAPPASAPIVYLAAFATDATGGAHLRPAPEQGWCTFRVPPLPSHLESVAMSATFPGSATPSATPEKAAGVGRHGLGLGEPLLGEADGAGSWLRRMVRRMRRGVVGGEPVPAPPAHERRQSSVELRVTITSRVPLVGWVILASALVAASSIGNALKVLGSRPGPLQLAWRYLAVLLVVGPYSLIAHRSALASLWRGAARPVHAVQLIGTAGAGLFQSITYFMALANGCSPPTALLFNNLTPLCLLAAKAAQGQGLRPLEIGGALVAVAGASTVAFASSAVPGGGASAGGLASLLSPLIAGLGSIGGAGYFLCAQRLRPAFPPVLLFTSTILCSLALLLPLFVIWPGDDGYAVFPPLDMSREGLFGFLRPERDRLMVLAYIALVCDGIGNMGYIVALKVVPPLSVTVVILLQPIVAMAEGAASGMDAAPSLCAVLGGLVLVCGTSAVVTASNRGTQTVVTSVKGG